MSLWKTSKNIHSALHDYRGIWARLLLHLIYTNGLAPYSIDLKTLPINELKKFATRPSRFEAHATGASPSPNMSALSITMPQQQGNFRLTYDDQVTEVRFSQIQLLPGGRWIYAEVFPTENTCELVCWDVEKIATSFQVAGSHVLTPVAKIAALRPISKVGWLRVTSEPQLDRMEKTVNILLFYVPQALITDQPPM